MIQQFSTQLDTQKLSALEQIEIVRLFQDQTEKIVTEALLNPYSHLIADGGDLYPPERAKACWRDFGQFIRCIT